MLCVACMCTISSQARSTLICHFTMRVQIFRAAHYSETAAWLVMQGMDLSQQSIKRQLKRAKLFEIQKLIKQIRMLENRKGTDVQLQKSQRKVGRLVEVLDAIKELNLGDLADEVYQSVQEEGSLSIHTCTGGQVSTDPRERAKHRLLTNKTFQRNITAVGTSKKGKPHSTTAQRTDDTNLQSEEQSTDASVSSSDSDENKEIDTSDRVLGSSTASTDTESECEFRERVMSDESADIKNVRIVERSGKNSLAVENTRTRMRRKTENVTGRQPGGSAPSNTHRLALESMFVSTLSADHPSAEHRKKAGRMKKAMKLKKNRPGQRTRQKQWEEVFGQKAKHVLEGRKKKCERKKGRGKPVNSSRASDAKSSKTAPHHHSPSQQQQQRLHPSWEAQKRKKAMESGIPQFQGQRTVFSDSD